MCQISNLLKLSMKVCRNNFSWKILSICYSLNLVSNYCELRLNSSRKLGNYEEPYRERVKVVKFFKLLIFEQTKGVQIHRYAWKKKHILKKSQVYGLSSQVCASNAKSRTILRCNIRSDDIPLFRLRHLFDKATTDLRLKSYYTHNHTKFHAFYFITVKVMTLW